MENLLTIMFTALQHTTYLVGFVAIKRSLLCVSFDWIAAYSWPQKDKNVETLIFTNSYQVPTHYFYTTRYVCELWNSPAHVLIHKK